MPARSLQTYRRPRTTPTRGDGICYHRLERGWSVWCLMSQLQECRLKSPAWSTSQLMEKERTKIICVVAVRVAAHAHAAISSGSICAQAAVPVRQAGVRAVTFEMTRDNICRECALRGSAVRTRGHGFRWCFALRHRPGPAAATRGQQAHPLY